MSDIREARKALKSRILEGTGTVLASLREAAYNNRNLAQPLSALVDKVANRAYAITDEDMTATVQSGLSEDQVFEIVVCAAVGAGSRQYGTALAALDAVAGRK
jgi:hypothetical protein